MKKAFACSLLFISLFVFDSISSALCVNMPEANLRTGPGINHKKSWQVFKYMPFKKIDEKGEWYKIEDVDGDTHWIYRKLVTDKIDCAVVKSEKVNVRSGPGTNFEKAFLSPAIKYDSFKVLKRDGSWVKVIDEFGDTGWIFRKFLWIY